MCIYYITFHNPSTTLVVVKKEERESVILGESSPFIIYLERVDVSVHASHRVCVFIILNKKHKREREREL